MKKLSIIICTLIVSANLFSAKINLNYSTGLIPDSLKKNAWGVVRHATTVFDYKSTTIGTEKNSIAITVLDKKGLELANFICRCDKFRTLKSFSGNLYDANGNLLLKYKMSDLQTTAQSDNNTLATDSRYYYFECQTPSFPFTIHYEYEVAWKNGILAFPLFVPQSGYNLSVEAASYQLVMPENTEFLSKAVNMKNEPSKRTNKGTVTYEWKVENRNAIESESLDPDLTDMIPMLYTNPKKFEYDGVPGTITDWESMGKWQFELNKKRDILTPETKSKVLEITKNATTDKEKVKLIYDYLGQTTRYVSIQLGIGGLQPIPAAEVCKTGFGDCKGLSNYMKAMLDVVGIPSNYVVIKASSSKKNLFPDYANFYQTDHVILQVPFPNDTLWLECTNPRVPFGFAHNNISGHDVLVNEEQGGKICKVTDYPDSLNIEKNRVSIKLNVDGTASVNMQKQCFVKIYDNFDWFPYAKSSEQTDALRKEINLPNVTMGTISVKEDKSALPSMQMDYSWTTPLYGTKTGARLFIPVNPFRTLYEGIKRNKRTHDIVISSGFKDIDSISIPIPEGFEIESLPASTELSTIFGHFGSDIQVTATEIIIKQTVFIASGRYHVSTFSDFVAFLDKINTGYKGRIILKKQTV